MTISSICNKPLRNFITKLFQVYHTLDMNEIHNYCLIDTDCKNSFECRWKKVLIDWCLMPTLAEKKEDENNLQIFFKWG